MTLPTIQEIMDKVDAFGEAYSAREKFELRNQIFDMVCALKGEVTKARQDAIKNVTCHDQKGMDLLWADRENHTLKLEDLKNGGA